VQRILNTLRDDQEQLARVPSNIITCTIHLTIQHQLPLASTPLGQQSTPPTPTTTHPPPTLPTIRILLVVGVGDEEDGDESWTWLVLVVGVE